KGILRPVAAWCRDFRTPARFTREEDLDSVAQQCAAQPLKVASSSIGTESAWLTGQPDLAPSAASWNCSAVMPGTVPVTLRTTPVMPVPGWNVTSAVVSSEVAGVPACASACESAIEKHVECAAAMSSSGLVCPSGSSVRAAHVTS